MRTNKVNLRVDAPASARRQPPFSEKFTLASLAIVTVAGITAYTHPGSTDAASQQGWVGYLLLALSIPLSIFLPRVGRARRFRAVVEKDGIRLTRVHAPQLLGTLLCVAGTVLVWNALRTSRMFGNMEAHMLEGNLLDFLFALVGAILAIFFIRSSITNLLGRTEPVLSPRGIHWSTARHPATLRWKDCPEPLLTTSDTVILLVPDERRRYEKTLTLAASACASDPRVILALIDFYRMAPGPRVELGDGGAIARIREGNLPIDWTPTRYIVDDYGNVVGREKSSAPAPSRPASTPKADRRSTASAAETSKSSSKNHSSRNEDDQPAIIWKQPPEPEPPNRP